MADLNVLAEAVIDGNAGSAKELTEKFLAQGISPENILNEGLVAGMNKVGEYFKANEFYVPEVLIAARAMQSAMDILKPKLVETGAEPAGVVAIGTVKGDRHDIGKNLVAMMLQGSGFEVMDLGVDAKPEKFARAVKDGAQIIGMSALLTTTMPNMKKTIDYLTAEGLRDKVKIIVGGAPVTEAFANEIGVDAYADDAADAAAKAKELLK